MKIKLVHDYFDIPTGSERCVEEFYHIFNKPLIYTIFDKLNKYETRTTFFQKYNFIKNNYNKLIFLFPFAVKSIKIKDSDIILSSSHSWVKNITKPKDSIHICYCHTPMRFAWDLRDIYIKEENKIIQPFIRLYLYFLRKWDYKNTNNVDYFIANSENVKKRIKKWYNRDAEVIYPPIDTSFFIPLNKKHEDYYLVVSRLIKQKNIETVIRCFNDIGLNLKIIGKGREYEYFKKISKKNIEFLGEVDDKKLRENYQSCKALIFPSEDDFGMVPVEAQACGKPVIAYGKGGALESVRDMKTGVFYYNNNPEDLKKAINKLNKININPKDCRKNSLKFDKIIFRKKIKDFVNRASKNEKRH